MAVEFGASFISANIRTIGLYLITTITHQWTCMCIPDCTYKESMFINLMKISLYTKSPMLSILYQFKGRWLYKRVHAANLVTNSGNTASGVWSILLTSEWFSLMAFWGTADIRVHIIHRSSVIIAYIHWNHYLPTNKNICFIHAPLKKSVLHWPHPHSCLTIYAINFSWSPYLH